MGSIWSYLSGDDVSTPPSHGKTEVKMMVTPLDFGPLSVIEGKHDSNFRANYWVTTPKAEFLVLHRFYGGNAKEIGQYWTIDERVGNEFTRADLAVKHHWNSMEKKTALLVPRGILLYEGFAAPQSPLIGGGAQVFIPQSVVEPLYHRQTLLVSASKKSKINTVQLQELIQLQQQLYKLKSEKAQVDILSRFHKRHIEIITSDSHNLALKGSHFGSLPTTVQSALRNAGNAGFRATKVAMRAGTYKVHEERIQNLIDGSYKTLSMSVKIEFVRSTTRTYKSGNTIVTETTNYYNIIYSWS